MTIYSACIILTDRNSAQKKRVEQDKENGSRPRTYTKGIFASLYCIAPFHCRNMQLIAAHVEQEDGQGEHKADEPESAEAKQELQGQLLLQKV